MIWISSEDIRQYLYCKRKIYWRDIVKIYQSSTKLMTYGLKFHFNKKKQIKSMFAIEHREYYMEYNDLHLSCIADLIIERKNSIIIVEFKNYYDYKQINIGIKLQLCFIAIIAEQHFKKKVDHIEVRTNMGKKWKIKLEKNDYDRTYKIIEEIRDMYKLSIIPEPTKNKNRCFACEYKNICLRV